MTQTAPTAAPSSPQPSPPAGPITPAPAAPQELPDALGRLILGQLPKKLDDLKKDTQRITALADGERDEESLAKLHAEIGRTVMAYITEGVEDLVMFGTAVLQFRNWAAYGHEAHAQHIDEQNDRLAVLEAVMLGGDSQLTTEDAHLFGTLATDVDYFATESLKMTTDPEGRAKLEEMLARSKQAQERIEEIVIDDEDDEDDEEDESAAATATATGAPQA